MVLLHNHLNASEDLKNSVAIMWLHLNASFKIEGKKSLLYASQKQVIAFNPSSLKASCKLSRFKTD